MTEHNLLPDASSVEDKAHAGNASSAADQHLPPTPHSLQGQTYNTISALESSSNPEEIKRIAPSVPRIPKLSPSTTELLSRVNANNLGDIKDGSSVLGKNQILNNPPLTSISIDNRRLDTKVADGMKVSSAIISLLTPPFTSSASQTAPSIPQKAILLPQKNATKTGLVAIAPKPQAIAAAPFQPPLVAPSPSVQSARISIEKTQRATASPRQRKRVANGSKRPKKRRRDNDSDEEIKAGDSSSDESSDFTPVATQTKSGRQIHRPSLYVPPSTPVGVPKPKKESPNMADGAAAQGTPVRKRRRVYRKGKEMNVNCIRCQRGNSPSTNMIVFCDECNKAWHQFCHDPPIEKEVISVKEAEWFCHECKPVERPAEEVTADTASTQQPALGWPAPQVPAVLLPTEVGGEQFSSDEKRAYLSSLSHTSLVNLLLAISDHHPTLPMFPPSLKDPPTSTFISSQTPAVSISKHPLAFALPQKVNESPVFPSTAVHDRKANDDESSESSEYEVEEHRLYPRAGNGFRIFMTPEDLDMLLDDPACPTFSYALHGPAKANAESAALVAVGSTA